MGCVDTLQMNFVATLGAALHDLYLWTEILEVLLFSTFFSIITS